MTIVGDTLAVDEWIKDKITLYRATKVEDYYGFPVQPTEDN